MSNVCFAKTKGSLIIPVFKLPYKNWTSATNSEFVEKWIKKKEVNQRFERDVLNNNTHYLRF